MTKIKISVPKVHCVKKNDFLNKDKVYLVVIVTTVTADSIPKIVFSGISGVSQKFKKGEIKVLNLGTAWTFDVKDDEVFNLSFGLYEYDNGDVYEKFQDKITEIVTTDGMNYVDVIEEIWKNLKDKVTSLNTANLLTMLPDVGLKILQNLRKDDLLGKRTFGYKGNDPNIEFVPEFDLTDAESFYKIQIELKKII